MVAMAKAKVAKACKAMKTLGYPQKTVKPILTNLLKLYDNKWELIEEDSFRVLVEAILDSEEQKARKDELENAYDLSEDEEEESEPLLKRSRRNSQENHSPLLLHSSISNRVNEVENQPHNNLCQHTDTQLNASYSTRYHHGKGKTSSFTVSHEVVEQTKETKLIYDVQSDEYNALVPLANLEYNGDEAGSCRVMVTYERRNDRYAHKEQGGLSDDDLASEEDAIDNYQCEAVLESDLLPLEGASYKVPLDELPPGCSTVIYSDAKGNCSTFPEVIDQDAEDISPLIRNDDTSVGNGSDLEGNHPESMNYEQSGVDKNDNDAKDLLNLVMASSSSGEVKISLTVDPSPRSDFCFPILEDVLKQVEEQCIKSYKIPQAGFSLLRLMNDVCECFLAAGTTSTGTDNIGARNDVVPSTGVSKDSRAQTVPSEGNDHQLCLWDDSTFPNNTVKFHISFDVSPQIPQAFRSQLSDFSQWNLNIKGCDKNGRLVVENNNVTCSSSRNMIVQKQQFFHYIDDISKGEEAHEISLINEINKEPEPTFNYISKNVKHQNAYMKSTLARISDENCCSNCIGDCLSLAIPCACACKTGGQFAYAPGGLLKEKLLDSCISMNHSAEKQNLVYCQDCPLERSSSNNLSDTCKGHLARKFIKECWYKCGCSMKCGNRVVQQGIRVKLQVFMTSEGKGWGVRTLEDVPKGSFICEYVGEVVTNSELYERSMHKTGDKHMHPILLDAGWSSESILNDEKVVWLDATAYGNVARFINHRCLDANLVEIPVEVETPDHHYYHLALFTTRKVSAFEELTWDYGIDFNDHTDPAKAFQCRCGSEFCRGQNSAKR